MTGVNSFQQEASNAKSTKSDSELEEIKEKQKKFGFIYQVRKAVCLVSPNENENTVLKRLWNLILSDLCTTEEILISIESDLADLVKKSDPAGYQKKRLKAPLRKKLGVDANLLELVERIERLC